MVAPGGTCQGRFDKPQAGASDARRCRPLVDMVRAKPTALTAAMALAVCSVAKVFAPGACLRDPGQRNLVHEDAIAWQLSGLLAVQHLLFGQGLILVCK